MNTTNQTIPEQTHAALIALGWKPPVVGEQQQPKQKDGLGEEMYLPNGCPNADTEYIKRYRRHRAAFDKLMPLAIRHGGRYGMPDKEWAVDIYGGSARKWESVYFNTTTSKFHFDVFQVYVWLTFHFPIGKAKDFLAEPGVDSLLRDFFFIVSGVQTTP